jgi:hypothetical protein
MFDEESLIHHMTESGFVNCRRRGHLDSEIPDIGDVEQSIRMEGGQGLAVEGRKID